MDVHYYGLNTLPAEVTFRWTHLPWHATSNIEKKRENEAAELVFDFKLQCENTGHLMVSQVKNKHRNRIPQFKYRVLWWVGTQEKKKKIWLAINYGDPTHFVT